MSDFRIGPVACISIVALGCTHAGSSRNDGGAALIDVVGFTQALFGALAVTLATPDKFDRFARAVLGDRDGEGVLSEQMKGVLTAARLQASSSE